MAYRYTNTDKWNDCWFSNLKPIEKLLFNYICDNCDIAGFIEINQKKWASDIGINIKILQGALKGLGRGLIYSNTNDCVYIKNFLKHQKNLPLNEKNKAHLGIIKRFDLYSYKFLINGNINEFIEGASKGLPSPTGNGNGNGIGNGIEEEGWKNNFEIYLSECKKAYKEYMENPELIKTQQRLNPGINVKLSIEKGFVNFWGKELGWKHKKKSKSKEIDWNQTITNSIDQKMNRVYYTKEELSKL
jgi:hypothetical protein